MTIKKLTDDQREILLYEPSCTGIEALRIIDAMTEALSAAERERETATRRAVGAEHWKEHAEARVRELESHLAAATALLSVDMPMASADEAEDWTEAVVAFNSGDMDAVARYIADIDCLSETPLDQPAAPLSDNLGEALVQVVAAEHGQDIAYREAQDRAEAEQAVLDAMGAIPEAVLREHQYSAAHIAELARRGLK